MSPVFCRKTEPFIPVHDIVIDATINRTPKISTPLGLLYEFLGSGEFQ